MNSQFSAWECEPKYSSKLLHLMVMTFEIKSRLPIPQLYCRCASSLHCTCIDVHLVCYCTCIGVHLVCTVPVYVCIQSALYLYRCASSLHCTCIGVHLVCTVPVYGMHLVCTVPVGKSMACVYFCQLAEDYFLVSELTDLLLH